MAESGGWRCVVAVVLLVTGAITPVWPAGPQGAQVAEAAGVVTFGGGDVEPVVPARLLDTRDGTGAPAGAVGASSVTVLQVTGRGGVPETAVGAVVLNVTAVDATEQAFVTVFPTGAPMPLASNLNVMPGNAVPNLVVAKLGVGGTISLYASHGSMHLIADVTGWFPELSGLQPMSPERLLDTRDGVGAPAGAVGPASATRLQVTGRAGIPETGVGAVVLNVTVTQPTSAGFVTVHPSGTTLPLASNLNFGPGQTVPNLVIAKVGVGGGVDLYNAFGTTHLIADVAGWFPDTAAFRSLAPERFLDTRDGVPVGPGGEVALQVTGRGAVPATGVGAVVMNLTAATPSAFGFVTAYPAGVGLPLASNVNVRPGVTVPNLVVVQVGAGGVVNLYNSHGSTHLIADVVGWFPSGSTATTTLEWRDGTVLAGPGDVVAASGSSDVGATLTLAPSADVPVVGGHLAVTPQPAAPTGLFGLVASVAPATPGTVVVLAPAPLDAGFVDIATSQATSSTSSLPASTAQLAQRPDSVVTCEGAAGVTISPKLELSIDAVTAEFSLRRRTAMVLMEGTATATFAAQTAGSYECETNLWGGLYIFGPTVVSIFPRVSLKVTGALKASASATGTVRLGFRIDGANATNLSDLNVDSTGDIDAEASVSVTFRPSVRAELALFGIAGSTVDLGVNFAGKVEPLSVPCAELGVQTTLDIGFKAGRFGLEWKVTLASITGPKLVVYERRDDCPAQDISWVGYIDVTYDQTPATAYSYDDQGDAWYSYTWARSYSYRISSDTSSLINRGYSRGDKPADVTMANRAYSETNSHWIRGGGPAPCNATYAELEAGPEEFFFSELLSDPDVWSLVDSPEAGDTVYLLAANFIGARFRCSDGLSLSWGTPQSHIGDELDIDFDCLAPAVPAGQRGYCVLPLTVGEGGLTLEFQGTLSGAHHGQGISTPATQTVSISLRKVVNEPG